jgi:hypothetical protein
MTTLAATNIPSRSGNLLRAWLLLVIALAWAWVIFEQINEQRSLHDAFVAGGALVLAAALLANRGGGVMRLSRAEAIIAASLTALGILSRVLFLDEYPPANGQLWEEAQMGLIALDSVRYDALDSYFPLPNLIAEVGFRLFGASMTDLRRPFLIAGIAAVPVFFLAARALGASAFAGAAATALFATSAYLASASRLAFETHSPTLTLCAALATAFHASRSRSTGAFALAGCFAGLLMTEYTSFKLYPPLLMAMLVLALRAAPETRRTAIAVARIGVFALAAIAVMTPLLIVPGAVGVQVEGIVRHRAGIEHTRSTLTERTLATGTRVRESAAQIFLRGSSNDVLPATTGVVDPYTGILGLAALAYCAYRAPRSPQALFLVATVGATVVLAGLLAQNPARYRITPIVPLYFLAIAMAIDGLRRRWSSPRLGAAIAVVVSTLCAVNLHLLLVVTVRDPHVQAEFGDRAMALALEIDRLQRKFGGPVLLDMPEVYLGHESDYAFLYRVDRVRVVRERADFAHLDGVLLADAARAGELRALPTTSDCSTETYEYGPLLSFAFFVCENRPSAQCSLDEDTLS